MSITYEKLIDPILRNVRHYAPFFSAMKVGDKVLDVCCGTGAQVIEYGRNGIVATGIDNDQNMVNSALRNKAKSAISNISFLLADAANLPFDDGSFDYASVSLGLHNKEEGVRNRIISEMKRVTSADGYLLFIDFNVPLPRNFWGILAQSIEFVAGGSHYKGFKDYIEKRGLVYILENHQLDSEKIDYLKSSLLTIVKARVHKTQKMAI
ncbi:MAG: methyltransferase domain-containing protein [Dehalococcoidia bacterium]|nr:MAG: methyltransferase domain-containing protein [Dehalococcoidia bacterium]